VRVGIRAILPIHGLVATSTNVPLPLFKNRLSWVRGGAGIDVQVAIAIQIPERSSVACSRVRSPAAVVTLVKEICATPRSRRIPSDRTTSSEGSLRGVMSFHIGMRLWKRYSTPLMFESRGVRVHRISRMRSFLHGER
jgi:hypothetical protein